MFDGGVFVGTFIGTFAGISVGIFHGGVFVGTVIGTRVGIFFGTFGGTFVMFGSIFVGICNDIFVTFVGVFSDVFVGTSAGWFVRTFESATFVVFAGKFGTFVIATFCVGTFSAGTSRTFSVVSFVGRGRIGFASYRGLSFLRFTPGVTIEKTKKMQKQEQQ